MEPSRKNERTGVTTISENRVIMKGKSSFIQRIFHWSAKQLIVQISTPRPRYRRPGSHCWLDIKLVPGKRVFHTGATGEDSWQSLEEAMSAAQRFIEEKYPEA